MAKGRLFENLAKKNINICMNNSWDLIKKGIILVRALHNGPASQESLRRVITQTFPDAFSQPEPSSRRKHFERIVHSLRHNLEAKIEYNRATKIYTLASSGPYLKMYLPADSLDGLAFIIHFLQEVPELLEEIKPLTDYLVGGLESEQAKLLSKKDSSLGPLIRKLNRVNIPHTTLTKIKQARTENRLLQFDYAASSIRSDTSPRCHIVEPYDLALRDGNLYLDAFTLSASKKGDPPKQIDKWTPYRIDKILPANINILPNKFSANTRSRRLISFSYRVSPRIHGSNMVYHFECMEVGEPEADGWVTITAKTNNLFDVHRKLLSIGQQCQALHPPELIEHMKNSISEMSALYAS